MTSGADRESDPSTKKSSLRDAISSTREFFDHLITTGRVSVALGNTAASKNRSSFVFGQTRTTHAHLCHDHACVSRNIQAHSPLADDKLEAADDAVSSVIHCTSTWFYFIFSDVIPSAHSTVHSHVMIMDV